MIGGNYKVRIYHAIVGTSTTTYPDVSDPLTLPAADINDLSVFIESKGQDYMLVMGQQSEIEVFDMYCDNVPIRMGDLVLDNKLRQYKVIGIERHDNNIETDDLMRVTIHSKAI